MTAADDEQGRREQRSRAVALFRYSLIRETADPGLTTRQRGRLVRELAACPHAGPFGEAVMVSRASLDRWILCGLDADDQGHGAITEPRLHQLVRQRGPSPSTRSRSRSWTRALKPPGCVQPRWWAT